MGPFSPSPQIPVFGAIPPGTFPGILRQGQTGGFSQSSSGNSSIFLGVPGKLKVIFEQEKTKPEIKTSVHFSSKS